MDILNVSGQTHSYRLKKEEKMELTTLVEQLKDCSGMEENTIYMDGSARRGSHV